MKKKRKKSNVKTKFIVEDKNTKVTYDFSDLVKTLRKLGLL